MTVGIPIENLTFDFEPVRSAGLLMFKREEGILKVFLVHPGGPSWEKLDEGAWTIPKGLVEKDEDIFETAQREFFEETGFASEDPYFPLGEITQKSGKIVTAWAFEGDRDPSKLESNYIEIAHPRGSMNIISIPEVDRGEYFTIEDAVKKINPRQVPFLQRLQSILCEDSELISELELIG